MLKFHRRFSWKLERSTPHPDFNLTSHVYKHSIGARLIHLEAPDPHKAFAVMFRTTPSDDTGVAHCLEHIVLCGSEQYPVRDPFFKMLSRSLNSYMNAWTGSDFTMYPFSTQNHQDFRNLLNVYLDAAYFPLLKYTDFRQEASRLEFIDGKLGYKGVVFNEMKGHMSDPSSYLYHKISSRLFEGNTYQYNSGGDPVSIPDLTHEQLKSFHENFYHPFNSTFFMYGDMNVTEHMQTIEDKIFSKFPAKQIDSAVKKIPKKDQSLRLNLNVPPDSLAVDDKNARFVITYMCDDPTEDPYKTFCLNILSNALFDGQSSPMYKALLESGLGKTFFTGSGYDTSTKQATFTIGLNGTYEKESAKIEQVVMNTLSDCMKNGIDSTLIESAIHQVEISIKQVKSNFGLLLISSMVSPGLHGEDPLTPLYINDHIAKLRTELKSGKKVFETLIEETLWKNNHKVIVNATPDDKVNKEIEKIHENNLRKEEEKLDEETKQQIIIEAQELLEAQGAPQNSDLLPTLKVEDIEKQGENIEYADSVTVDSVPIHFIHVPTNGISYIRMKVDVSDLPIELRPLLPLYTRFINQVGTKLHSHGDFDNLKNLNTVSGVSCGLSVTSGTESADNVNEFLSFKIGFLDRNLESAFEILSELFTSVSFKDHQHLSFLLQKSVKNRTDNIISNSRSYAVSLASSSLTPAANSYENLGILKHDCYLASSILSGLEVGSILNDVTGRLAKIHSCLMKKSLMSILVHSSNDSLKDKMLERFSYLFNSLKLEFPFAQPLEKLPVDQFHPFLYQAYFKLPMQTNYVIESFKSVPFCHPDYPTLTVLSDLMSLNMLFHEIREKGGAYGAGFINDPHKCTISLFSYMDPNRLKTYVNFEKAVRACSEAQFEQRNVDEAKLSAFSKIDAPKASYEKGVSQFLYGVDNQMRQEYRESVLRVSIDDIRRVTDLYLRGPLEQGFTSKVIFGGEDVDRKAFSGWKIDKPIDILAGK